MSFKDYFSGHAADYASYRPDYPAELFTWLAGQCPQQESAWDCATGNGQAANALADHFQLVIGTDASLPQLAATEQRSNVFYTCASAEQVPLRDSAIDLITVAQAAHWFDLTPFYREVDRVFRPGGLLALWCYGLFNIEPAIDKLINEYYSDTVGNYWPPERRHIELGYQELPFPYSQLRHPAFHMSLDWNLAQVLGYLATWSATRLYIKVCDANPLLELRNRLLIHWGDPATSRPVHWPLMLKVGKKP